MVQIQPWELRDFSAGRITPEVVSFSLVPPNSVKDVVNVNFDEIVGSAKVRFGTESLFSTGDISATGIVSSLGLAEFVPKLGSNIGPNLATNGSFTGSAAGWTLGTGWAYGTNNVVWTGLEADEITNGSFTGSASGWTLGSGWTYNTNKVATNGAETSLSQASLPMTRTSTPDDLGLYLVTFTTSNSNGGDVTVGIVLPSESSSTRFLVVDGTYSFPLQKVFLGTENATLSFTPHLGPNFPAFTGNIDNVSFRKLNQGVLSQDMGLVADQIYQVTITTGGTTGFVTISAGTGSRNMVTVPAGVTSVVNIVGGGSSSLSLVGSPFFDGTVDNIQVQLVTNRLLLAVFATSTAGTVYYYNGVVVAASDLTTLSPIALNRFSTLGGSEFLTNNVDGMYSSTDGATWVNGTSNNCIDSGDATPSLVFRYQQRLVASGDPTYPDRVFFSSVIDPTASPFITWNTDPNTGDWIDVNPDDGGNVTGFSENSTFLLVFKNTGMYRLDVLNKTVDPDNIFDVGAASQEGIVLCMGVTYFFSGNGVYRTNGGYPEQISRAGVQDIILSLPPSAWSSVASGTDGLNVYFSLGNVVLNEGEANEKFIDNCVLKFSPRDQSWSVHSYASRYRFFAQYTDGNGPLIRGSEVSTTPQTVGVVETLNLGTTDFNTSVAAGSSINFFLETQDQDFGNRARLKGISDEIAVYVDQGGTSQFSCRVNGAELVPTSGPLNNRVNIIGNVNFQGNFLNFYWFGSSNGDSPILEGIKIENIKDQGFQGAVGGPEAPPTPRVIT